MGYQSLKGSDGTCGDDIGAALETRGKILDALGMHVRWSAGNALRLAQECNLFAIAFNEVNESTWLLRQRAGNHQPGKSASRAQVDPNSRIGRELEKLEGIGNVPRPQFRGRGWCNQVGGALPMQQQRDEPVQPFACFT